MKLDTTSLDWTKDSQMEIKNPCFPRRINNMIYLKSGIGEDNLY